jgi:hypothetical protein
VYLELNAQLQLKASALGAITFLTEGEIAAVLRTRGSFTYERALGVLVSASRARIRSAADGRAAGREGLGIQLREKATSCSCTKRSTTVRTCSI